MGEGGQENRRRAQIVCFRCGNLVSPCQRPLSVPAIRWEKVPRLAYTDVYACSFACCVAIEAETLSTVKRFQSVRSKFRLAKRKQQEIRACLETVYSENRNPKTSS